MPFQTEAQHLQVFELGDPRSAQNLSLSPFLWALDLVAEESAPLVDTRRHIYVLSVCCICQKHNQGVTVPETALEPCSPKVGWVWVKVHFALRNGCGSMYQICRWLEVWGRWPEPTSTGTLASWRLKGAGQMLVCSNRSFTSAAFNVMQDHVKYTRNIRINIYTVTFSGSYCY